MSAELVRPGRKLERLLPGALFIPAQLAFSAVRVPAGRHTIDWREIVPGGRISRWGPVLFVLAAALLWRSKWAGNSPEKA